MRNDVNYKVLSCLTPKPTPEEAVRILVGLEYKTVTALSRKILTSHTSINRVLDGENLPNVRREILSALEMTIDPWRVSSP